MDLQERFDAAKKQGMRLALNNGHAMHPFTISKGAGVYSTMSHCTFCHAHLYVTVSGEHPTDPGGAAVDNVCRVAWVFREYIGGTE